MTEGREFRCSRCGRWSRADMKTDTGVFVCPWCHSRVLVDMADTRSCTPGPVEDEPAAAGETENVVPFVPRAKEAQPMPPGPGASPGETGNRCARCGRVFRGDWDRNLVDGQVYCDICARSVDMLDRGIAAQPQTPEPGPMGEALQAVPWVGPEDEAFRARLKEEEEQRRKIEMAVLAGVAALCLALVWIWPGGKDAGSTVPAPLGLVGFGLSHFIGIFLLAGAVYLALASTGRLPGNTLAGNAAVILPVAVIAYLVNLFPWVGGFLCVAVVYTVYDLDVRGILFFFLFYLASEAAHWVVESVLRSIVG